VGDEAGGGPPAGTPPPPTPPRSPRTGPFVGAFGATGFAFLALAVAAVAGTAVVMNWDVWVRGEPEEVVGGLQMLSVIMALVASVAFAAAALLWRRR